MKTELCAGHEKNYYLGIDGGGTKTEFALVDEEGKVLNHAVSGASNPVDVGLENCITLLKNGIRTICEGYNLSCVCAYAGISGGITGDFQERIYAEIEKIGLKKHGNGSDINNILEAGLHGKDGIAMIMGTGICLFSSKNGVLHRTAGLGYLLDNGGGGYNLGRDALQAYFAALDGSGAKTVLTGIIGKNVENTATFLKEIYEKGKKYIASFAPVVFEACAQKDKVAQAILEKNAAEAARLLECSGKVFNEKVKVVITGGLTRQKILADTLYGYLSEPEKFEIEVLNERPVFGAVALAKKLI